MDELFKDTFSDNYVECYGNLNMADSICRKYCALRLKCAIEQKQQMRMLSIEDLMTGQEVPLKFQ